MSKAALGKDHARAILDALSDNPSNAEDDALLRQHNPTMYEAVLLLRKMAHKQLTSGG